jgi:hypothetical protein
MPRRGQTCYADGRSGLKTAYGSVGFHRHLLEELKEFRLLTNKQSIARE